MSRPKNLILFCSMAWTIVPTKNSSFPPGWGLLRAPTMKAAKIHYYDNKDRIRIVVMSEQIIDVSVMTGVDMLITEMIKDENLNALIVAASRDPGHNHALLNHGAHITYLRRELTDRLNETLEHFKDKDALYALKVLEDFQLYSADLLFSFGPWLHRGQTTLMHSAPHPRIGEPGMRSNQDKEIKVLVDPWGYDKPMCTSMTMSMREGKAELIEVPLAH